MNVRFIGCDGSDIRVIKIKDGMATLKRISKQFGNRQYRVPLQVLADPSCYTPADKDAEEKIAITRAAIERSKPR